MSLNENSLIGAARHFGLGDTYFLVIRNVTPDKFNYLMSFDKDMITSIEKYKIFVSDLRDEMISLVYKYEENKVPLQDILVATDTYRSRPHSTFQFEAPLFRAEYDSISMRYSVVIKWLKISKYIKDHIC